MTLCVVFLPESFPVDYKKSGWLNQMQEVFAGAQSLLLEAPGDRPALDTIQADYFLFIDRVTEFDPGFFNGIMEGVDPSIDFLQLTPRDAEENILMSSDVLYAGWDNILGLKAVHKSLLLHSEVFDFERADRRMIADFYFQLFQEGASFRTTEKAGYRQHHEVDLQSIKTETKLIRSLLLSKNRNEQRKFLVLYKRALIGKFFSTVDTRAFADLFPYSEQEELLSLFKDVFHDIDDAALKQMAFEGYIPFVRMIREELYTEAVYYLRLLRGKRYWFKQSRELDQKVKQFPIQDSTSWKISAPFRKVRKLAHALRSQVMKTAISLLSLPVRLRYAGQEVWIISERPDQAEDNGYMFFKYCRETMPDAKIFYLIDKHSPHYDRVKKLGNVIHHSSLMHWLYLLAADKYISAWVFEEFSLPKGTISFKKIFSKAFKKKAQITLQHGVIIHNIAPYLSKELYNQKLFIASSDAEKEVIMETLGYEDAEVQVTGLSRFDNLHNLKVKKQILIMPTWRRSLFQLNKSEFMRSQYFTRYYQLVRNEKLLQLAEEHDITIAFYVHSQMQQFLPDFAFEHPRVCFLTKKDAVVSDLLKESALLITDYSSVMADFLYMEKPVLLYQFDSYDNHHGPVNAISYSDFGEIFTNEDALADAAEKNIENNFELDSGYREKSNRFFTHKDQRHSERIYQAIKNLPPEKGAEK